MAGYPAVPTVKIPKQQNNLESRKSRGLAYPTNFRSGMLTQSFGFFVVVIGTVGVLVVVVFAPDYLIIVYIRRV